jgi:hypothetical protein
MEESMDVCVSIVHGSNIAMIYKPGAGFTKGEESSIRMMETLNLYNNQPSQQR